MISVLTRSPGSPPSTTCSTTVPSQSATVTAIEGTNTVHAVTSSFLCSARLRQRISHRRRSVWDKLSGMRGTGRDKCACDPLCYWTETYLFCFFQFFCDLTRRIVFLPLLWTQVNGHDFLSAVIWHPRISSSSRNFKVALNNCLKE